MKKVFLFLIVGVSCFFFSCQKRERATSDWMHNNGRVKVMATTAMIADLVQTIGGEHIDVAVLIPPLVDPHSYELVKGDDEKFARSEMIFYNGLGLEHGISLRRQLEAYQDKTVCVTAPLLQREPSPLLKVENTFDPHVWMDISLWSATLEPICDALSRLLPDHHTFFCDQKEKLRLQLEIADKNAYEKLQAIVSAKRFLVTSHDAFHYFTRRYLADPEEKEWYNRCSAPEGLAPEAELSTVDLLEVLEYIQLHDTRVLFTEANLHSQAIRKLLQAGNKRGLMLRVAERALYADSMGFAKSYVEMVQHNVDVIAEELSK